MRFDWILDFVPDARGVRWAFGLLLLPAVWLARGPAGPAGPRAGAPRAAVAEAPVPQAFRALAEPRALGPRPAGAAAR